MQDKQPSLEYNTENIPQELPILPLFDATLFPKMVLPLVVMKGESVHLIDEAMANDRMIGLLVAQKKENVTPDPDSGDLASVGTAALILKMAKTQDNQTQMLVQGISRFKVKGYDQEKPYLIAQVEHIKEKEAEGKEIEALMTNLVNNFNRVVELSPGMPSEVAGMAKAINEPGTLANMVASTLNVDAQNKQEILEIDDVKIARQIYDSGTALFVDARAREAYEDGHIPGAVSLPVGQFDTYIDSFIGENSTDGPIVAYCSGRTCEDSHKLAQLLLEIGFVNVRVFIDGFPGWEAEGYPIE